MFLIKHYIIFTSTWNRNKSVFLLAKRKWIIMQNLIDSSNSKTIWKFISLENKKFVWWINIYLFSSNYFWYSFRLQITIVHATSVAFNWKIVELKENKDFTVKFFLIFFVCKFEENDVNTREYSFYSPYLGTVCTHTKLLQIYWMSSFSPTNSERFLLCK